MKKLSVSKLNKAMQSKSKEELIIVLTDLYKKIPAAADYMNVRLGDTSYESDLLEKAKTDTRKYLYPSRGKTRIREAKTTVEGFGAVCSDCVKLIDLELHCVEAAVDYLQRYYTGDPYHAAAEAFYLSALEKLNKSEDDSVFEHFRPRLETLISESVSADANFHDFLKNEFNRLKWISGNSVGYNASGNGASSGSSISSETPNDTISEQDSDLFYQLWPPLFDYANNILHINDCRNISGSKALDPAKMKEIADVVWGNVSLIETYLEKHGQNLPEDHRQIISGWKNAIHGHFCLERILKKGAILISAIDNKVYQVKGLKSSWDELFGFAPLPILLDTTLLPFRDVIITDGLFSSFPALLGRNIRSQFRESYTTAKRQNRILTSL